MKSCRSNKLYYGKYLYKLVIHNTLATLFSSWYRGGNYSVLRVALDQMQEQLVEKSNELHYSRGLLKKGPISVNNFLNARDIFNTILQTDVEYRLRTENSYITLYSNDKKFLEKICNKMRNECCKEFWQPDSNAIDLLYSEDNIVIVNSPNEYKFKIYLNTRSNTLFADWLEKNYPKVKVGNGMLTSLRNGSYSSGYFYAKDEKILLLAEIASKGKFQKIERLVYVDKYS